MDFTIKKYKELLSALINAGYTFQTYSKFIETPAVKTIILRHDVDKDPLNSLRFAELQNKLNIKGSYYFRAVPQSWNKDVIIKIAKLGHEVGYHYENITTCKGNIDKAIIDFEQNLKKLRELTTVKTICMHGSPMSQFDSRLLWNKFNYKDFDIIAEPYFDTDFSKVFYLTDTGRMWDGFKVSLRDKIPEYQQLWINSGLLFHSTKDIIEATKANNLPQTIMFTFHPQRWNSKFLKWSIEIISQNVKNIIKRLIIISKSK